jgi:GxxExxY protein
MVLLYEEISGKILEACFEVINELGAGFLESVYQNALTIALKQNNVHFETQYPISVAFRGENIGQFYADFFVEGKIIVEIKAVSALLPEHQAQLINYLKATGIEIGLLVNFGKPKLEYRRLHK